MNSVEHEFTDERESGKSIFTDGRKKLPQRLKRLIDTRSKNSFATQVGISAGQLDQYLDGSLPGMDVLLRIVEKTGCNAEWLLTGIGPGGDNPYPPQTPADPQGQAALAEGMRRSAASAIEALYAVAATAKLAATPEMLPDVDQITAAASAAGLAITKRLQEMDMSKRPDVSTQKKTGPRPEPGAS